MTAPSLETETPARRAPDAWAVRAARLPLAFSQVREDPEVDVRAMEGLPADAEIVMIASGGDTAAWLAATGRIARCHLVDANPAQLALTRVKLRLLAHDPAERLALLGHAPLPATARAARLARLLRELGLPTDALGPMEIVAWLGPDFAGRYERLFAELQRELEEYRGEIGALLDSDEPDAEPSAALDDALRQAIHRVFRLENLVCLFGEQATQNPRVAFAAHFHEQLRGAFAICPPRRNPFLAQFLAGGFRHGITCPWLTAPAPEQMPDCSFRHGTMQEALRTLPPASVDFVHLSNILDWLAPAEAAEILRLTHAALRPGERVLVRQLNSTVDVCAAGPGYSWHRGEAEALRRRDRSFFYRQLHLGEKPRS